MSYMKRYLAVSLWIVERMKVKCPWLKGVSF